MLQTHLDAAGFTFFGATSGEEALKLVAAAPRLIILDVTMRGLDGFETCRRLRLDPAPAGVPMLLLTACKTEADVLAAKAVGANDSSSNRSTPAARRTGASLAGARHRRRDPGRPP